MENNVSLQILLLQIINLKVFLINELKLSTLSLKILALLTLPQMMTLKKSVTFCMTTRKLKLRHNEHISHTKAYCPLTAIWVLNKR